MDLRFDDPDGSAKCLGSLDRLVRARRDAASGDGNPVVPKDVLGLIFVQIHSFASARCAKPPFSRKTSGLTSKVMSCEAGRFSMRRKVVHSPPPTACGPTDTIHALRATFLPVAKTRPAKRSRREARR
jgi:hypothetical protein